MGASAVCVSMYVTSVGVLRGVDVTVGVSVLVCVGLAVGVAVDISVAGTASENEQACTNKTISAIKINFRICSLIHAMILRTRANFRFYSRHPSSLRTRMSLVTGDCFM